MFNPADYTPAQLRAIKKLDGCVAVEHYCTDGKLRQSLFSLPPNSRFLENLYGPTLDALIKKGAMAYFVCNEGLINSIGSLWILTDDARDWAREQGGE